MFKLGAIFCILIIGLLCFDLQTAYGQSLPTCPIGMDGAPNLRNPGIASGSECRGACGEDCPSDRCDPLAHIVIPIYDASGQQYNCVYNNVVRCLTHNGCQDHDACYDKCAEPISSGGAGETSMLGPCHLKCNDDCYNKWGRAQCGAWSDVAGYVADYWVDPDFGGYLLFSDPPKLLGPIRDKSQGSKTGNEAQVSPVSSDGEGWYLQGEPVITKDEEIDLPPCYTGRTVTVTNGEGHGSVTNSAECFKEGYGTFSSDVTWTPPPAYMKPGKDTSFSMTFTSPDENPTGGAIKADGGTIVEGSSRNLNGKSTATYTVPDGSPGDELEIYTSFVMISGLHGYVNYNYKYQEAGTTAAPATQSEVIYEENAPESVDPVNIGGTWNLYVESEFVGTGQIIQDGGSLTFINHNGQQSSGRFIDSNTVEATDWEDGLRGTLTSDGNRIDWATSMPSSWTRD